MRKKDAFVPTSPRGWNGCDDHCAAVLAEIVR